MAGGTALENARNIDGSASGTSMVLMSPDGVRTCMACSPEMRLGMFTRIHRRPLHQLTRPTPTTSDEQSKVLPQLDIAFCCFCFFCCYAAAAVPL